MRRCRRVTGWSVAIGAIMLLPLRAAADDRLAGYWVPAPGEAPIATFSFGILGRWTIVTAHWDGSAPDFKVRYTVVSSGESGTLTADEKLDRQPEAPRTIGYTIKSADLFLSIPDTAHAGRYHLVKGEPPANASAAPPPAPVPDREGQTGPARPPRPAPARDPNAVLGNWATEPGAAVRVKLFIAMAGPKTVKINEEWTKANDAPVTSRATEYEVNFTSVGSGTFSRNQPDYDGSLIPLHLGYRLEQGALVVTVDNGTFVGEYRLVHPPKPG